MQLLAQRQVCLFVCHDLEDSVSDVCSDLGDGGDSMEHRHCTAPICASAQKCVAWQNGLKGIAF